MDEEVFLYDPRLDAVCSLATYHAQNCMPIEPLVEAHPHIIYFYATLTPS